MWLKLLFNKWTGLLLLVGSSALLGWLYLNERELRQLEHKAHAAELKAAKTVKKQDDVTIQVVTEYVDRVKVVREQAKTIVKEVPVYVKVDHCPLSGGFRVLHDAAATNTVPDPARIADAPAAAASDVATTVTENYGTCHEIREQLTSLQAWILKQQELSKHGR